MCAAKDDYRVQQPRLERLAKELTPGCEVHFSPEENPMFLEMRVDHAETGAVLYISHGDWRYSQIADKSDEELKQLLRSWINWKGTEQK